MKKIIYLFVLITSCQALEASTVNFTDKADLVIGTPPISFSLDTTPYPNAVIGNGSWELTVSPESTIDSLAILHSIFLFSSGVLNNVTVLGTTSAAVALTANPNTPGEQTFAGSVGSQPDEYVFLLSNYSLDQGGETVITGFDSITSISFSGSFTSVPEPASSTLLISAATLITASRRTLRDPVTRMVF